jgi:hypothetical protein
MQNIIVAMINLATTTSTMVTIVMMMLQGCCFCCLSGECEKQTQQRRTRGRFDSVDLEQEYAKPYREDRIVFCVHVK